MGLCNSPDIFQEKVSELMEGLQFMQTYIDDLLVITNGSFEDHINKLDSVLEHVESSGLKINAGKLDHPQRHPTSTEKGASDAGPN